MRVGAISMQDFGDACEQVSSNASLACSGLLVGPRPRRSHAKSPDLVMRPVDGVVRTECANCANSRMISSQARRRTTPCIAAARAVSHDQAQKRLMLHGELGGSTSGCNVYQTVRSLFVDPSAITHLSQIKHANLILHRAAAAK